MAASNFKNLQGQRFGMLTVVKRMPDKIANSGKPVTQWLCQCDCGGTTITSTQRLTSGHTTSCGCKVKANKGSRFEDLTGQRFNRLTVIRYLDKSERTVRTYNWLCRCDCGKLVKGNANKLKNGLQKSCGCLKEECKYDIGEVNKKYEHVNKRLYSVYKGMLNRCYDPQHQSYKSYGGRGITVCQEWLDDYDCFAEWALANGYDPKAKQGDCTIDRKDVNKGYSPDNCKWVSNAEQANNRRDNVRITYNGETHTMSQWSKILNVNYSSLWRYIRGKGMTLEEFIKFKNVTY